jgi:hypothetical protein
MFFPSGLKVEIPAKVAINPLAEMNGFEESAISPP